MPAPDPDRHRRTFRSADAWVRLLSGLLGVLFMAWMIYLTFFRK